MHNGLSRPAATSQRYFARSTVAGANTENMGTTTAANDGSAAKASMQCPYIVGSCRDAAVMSHGLALDPKPGIFSRSFAAV